ncbi:TonB-dependent receptor [Luminiphilus sp.]|nr:TonB-dependent receptor [Luminiphilus sp.]MDB2586017.1 TonB-dependent receptor [Luminiphilus sp.]
MQMRCLTLAAAVLSAISAQSFAQQSMEEVVVTATKRTESIQDVPMSVSVISGEVLERAEVRDLLDLQSVVPSLRVPQFQNSIQTNFVIRGFGNGANNPGIEPSVAVFVDGVYLSRSQARISDLPNIQQIEVLKGPQSTLYGKNASAGVISVTTKAPEFESRGSVEVGFGNYSQESVRAFYTGPLSDSVAVSLSGTSLSRDGYFDNVPTGTDFNNRNRWSTRADFLIEGDDSELRVILDYDEIDEVCCGTANLVNGPAGFALAPLSVVPGQAYIPEDAFNFKHFGNFDTINKGENKGVTVDYQTSIGDIDVRSITAYRDSYFNQPLGDVDFTGADVIGNSTGETEIKTFTQEFRLTGTAGNADWLLGGFYFDESIDFENGIEFGSQWRNYINLTVGGGDLAAGEAALGGLEALLGYTPGTFLADGDGVLETATQDNESYSVFGQVTFPLSSKTNLTVGLNYLNDEKEITLSQENNDGFSNLSLRGEDGITALTNLAYVGGLAALGIPPLTDPTDLVYLQTVAATAAAIAPTDSNPFVGFEALQFLPQVLGIPNAAEPGTSNDSKTTYTVSLSHAYSDDLNLYATYGTGFKSTSWNLSRDSRPTVQERDGILSAGGVLPNNLTIGTRLASPEDAQTIEFGAKYSADWGTLNAAIFDQSIEGFQSNAFLGTGFALTNAGKQSTKGVELDLMVRASEALTIALSATYLDPIYDDFTGAQLNGQPADFTGLTPAGVHELSLSAVATYNFNISGMDGFIQADYQYDSAVDINGGGDLSNNNIALGSRGFREREVRMINASFGLTRGDWDLRIWGRNLTNDEWLITWFPAVAQTGSLTGYPNQPRTYGATLRRNF